MLEIFEGIYEQAAGAATFEIHVSAIIDLDYSSFQNVDFFIRIVIICT